MKICGAILVVIAALGIAKFWKRKMFFVLIACGLVCFAAAAVNEYSYEQKPLESIEKNDTGEGGFQRELIVKTGDGREIEISVDVPEKNYTKAEAREILQNEKQNLERTILGENKDFENIRHDMDLPDAGQNQNVSITWQSSDPGVISSDGEIQSTVSKNGRKVILNAVLTLQEEETEYIKEIKVYPNEDKESLEAGIKKEIERQNSENAGEEFVLPESVGNVELVWYEAPETSYAAAAFLILAAGVLMRINEKQKDEERVKKRNEILKKEYPEFISRLLLMLYSGTGVRTAFFKMAQMYDRSKKETGIRSEVFEETMTACREMETGSSEDEAYVNMSERCPPACYRRLSVLLIQNRKRGGKGFIDELEQEVLISFGEKKRQAEAEGNAASLKLLIPLGMMLMVVLALMMIPAFLYM